jgi:hypothetical protein
MLSNQRILSGFVFLENNTDQRVVTQPDSTKQFVPVAAPVDGKADSRGWGAIFPAAVRGHGRFGMGMPAVLLAAR